MKKKPELSRFHAAGEVHRLVGAARRGQDAGALAAGQVEQPDLGMVGRVVPVERRRRRSSHDTPPGHQPPPGSSASLRRPSGFAGSTRVRVCTISARRPPLAVRSSGTDGVEQPAAEVQPAGHVVPHVRLGDARVTCSRGEVEAVDLRRLVAAGAALEDDRVAGQRLVARLRHRLGEIGELLELAHRRREAMDLRRAGAGLAMRDQHLAPARMPVDEAVAAEVGVARDLLRRRSPESAECPGARACRSASTQSPDPAAGGGGRSGGARRRRRRRRHRRAGGEERGRGEGGKRES